MPRFLKLGIAPLAVSRAQARELLRRVDRLAQSSEEAAVHLEIIQVRAPGETATALFGAAEGAASHSVETLRKALQRRQVDVVLHHLADRPGALHPSDLAAVLERGPSHDALLGSIALRELPAGARVAVGSMRCRAQLRHQRPDLQPVHLRGGPGTCIDKLHSAAVEALLLPMAVVGWQDETETVQEELSSKDFIPAAGQGTLALEVRREEPDLLGWAQLLEHPESRLCAATELAFAERVGITLANGIHARMREGKLKVLAFISGFDAEERVLEGRTLDRPGSADEAHRIGLQLAEEMLTRRGGSNGVARLILLAPLTAPPQRLNTAAALASFGLRFGLMAPVNEVRMGRFRGSLLENVVRSGRLSYTPQPIAGLPSGVLTTEYAQPSAPGPGATCGGHRNVRTT